MSRTSPPGALYTGVSRPISIYDLRRAIAALVWVKHHVDGLEDLDDHHVVLIDQAVRQLAERQRDLNGDLGAATRSLLSTEPDIGGRRTGRAIDRLGALTHVDDHSAEALASLRPTDDVDDEPLRLLDLDSAKADR